MFRVSRLVFPKGSSYNLPLLSQWNQSKQLIVEFSIIPDNKETLQEKRTADTKKPIIQGTLNSMLNQGYFKGDILQDLNELQKIDENRRELIQTSRYSTPTEVVKILKRVAESGRRPVDFLEEVSSMMQNNSWVFSLREISDALYSCAKLSYRNENFIKSLTKPMKKGIADSSPKMASSILHSLGTLRYRDCELLDVLLKSLLNHSLDIKTSVECLMSLSFLNYPCSYASSLAKFLAELNETDYHQTSHYINFVWACVILNQLEYVKEKHIPKIASEAFWSQISVSGYHPGIALKLLNIQAVAQQLNQKTNQRSPSTPVLKMPPRYAVQKKTQFFDSVMDTLSYILPGSGYFKTAIDTGAGFFLDVECAVNSRNHPVPLNKGNYTKVALILLEYKETCSDNSPTGIFDFKLRVLKQLGYRTIVLHHAEYPLGSLLSVKIDFLRQKLSELDMSSVKKSTQNAK